MIRISRALTSSFALVALAACAISKTSVPSAMVTASPSPDPRVGLRAGLFDAGEAVWNLRVVSKTPPSEKFLDAPNTDLAFTGRNVIQGSFNGFQVWDISNPERPSLATAYYCPASQSDVSTYRNLLFVSGEGLSGRLDCGAQGVKEVVSKDRLRGLRIFDISDVAHPRNVGNVQTCRGSHTHSVLVDPKDPETVWVYISGSSSVRSAEELSGCLNVDPDKDPNSALFRIEVIKVPVAHPEQAAIVASPRIFNELAPVTAHRDATEDIVVQKHEADSARAAGGYVATVDGRDRTFSNSRVESLLDSIVAARRGTGAPTAADSAALRANLSTIAYAIWGKDRPRTGPTQCHDITLYPAVGLAGGACEGYGFLVDIRDPAHPVRLRAVADSNFSYWHSATFNNDGTKILFSDEWGGGRGARCRVTDLHEWGADAIFTITPDRQMQFRSYYKMPAPQTPQENCVAHNGSLVPIPGRDVMAQAWYQGGISVFDWTDASHPREIAFFDRGPMDSTRLTLSGSWSVYWYNGVLVSSEISRGLDIFELTPSAFLSQNEIDAAKTVKFDYLNTQGQQKIIWPPSFALARAYLDQLERSKGLAVGKIASARSALTGAEAQSGNSRADALSQLATNLEVDAKGARDSAKVRLLAGAVRDLAAR